ncbi:ferritin family protein [Candidatus Omnitrophota bacterium]
MANVFKLTEIVDMGIEKEKARRDFYDRVSQQFEDKQLKELFEKLRDWEKDHVIKFQGIRDALNEPGAAESFTGEMSGYMDALVGDQLYKDVSPEAFSNNITTPILAIDYGIGFEKDAILFFSELSRFTQSSKQDVIKQLIDEEKQHIVFLADLKKKLKA